MNLLLGNCQLQRMMFICGINGVTCNHLANTERIDGTFDVDRVLEAVKAADIVITQPIFNEDSPLYHGHISALAKEVVFFPYVYIDGIFSLSSADIGSPVILGEEHLHRYMKDEFPLMVHDFLNGQIGFNNEERFKLSLEELKRREHVSSSIPIADVIEANYQVRPLLLTHNHPEKWLMNILCARLFDRLGWSYRSYEDSSHRQRVDYMFGLGETVLSPYDVEVLSLRFAPDDQWWTMGHRLLSRYWKHRFPDQEHA